MIYLEMSERVWLRRIAITAGLLVGVSIVAYFAWFGVLGQPLADTTAGWGQFGDYVGGFAGTILAGATVALLVMSVLIQLETYRTTREELKATSQALADQLEQSRERSALDSFQSTLEIFLARKGVGNALRGATGTANLGFQRGDFTDWNTAHQRLRLYVRENDLNLDRS